MVFVTGSDILSLVEVQRWRHKTWDESDVIKFARNVNWISAHWLNSCKASLEEHDAAFLIVSFTFCTCILSEFYHILDQWKEMSLTRVMEVYLACMLFTPIYGSEEGKIGLVWILLFFGSNPWRQFIELLEICCKYTNIHESVENKISDFWLHKAQNIRACHIYAACLP